MKKELVIKISAGVVALLAIASVIMNVICLNKISENQKQIAELKEETSDLDKKISELKAEMKEKTDLYDELWGSQMDINDNFLEMFGIIQEVFFW